MRDDKQLRMEYTEAWILCTSAVFAFLVLVPCALRRGDGKRRVQSVCVRTLLLPVPFTRLHGARKRAHEPVGCARQRVRCYRRSVSARVIQRGCGDRDPPSAAPLSPSRMCATSMSSCVLATLGARLRPGNAWRNARGGTSLVRLARDGGAALRLAPLGLRLGRGRDVRIRAIATQRLHALEVSAFERERVRTGGGRRAATAVAVHAVPRPCRPCRAASPCVYAYVCRTSGCVRVQVSVNCVQCGDSVAAAVFGL